MDPIKNSKLIVIGSSAGGMEALKKLVAQFPRDFPAPIFIVNHMSADTTGEALVRALNASSSLHAGMLRMGRHLKALMFMWHPRISTC